MDFAKQIIMLSELHFRLNFEYCLVVSLITCHHVGTPGFRAPECMTGSVCQSEKVDCWAVGICMASLMTGRYPFLLPPNDYIAMLQLTKMGLSNIGFVHLTCEIWDRVHTKLHIYGYRKLKQKAAALEMTLRTGDKIGKNCF